MKYAIKAAFAAIMLAAFTSCVGYTFQGETPYGTIVNNADGTLMFKPKPPKAPIVESAKSGLVDADK